MAKRVHLQSESLLTDFKTDLKWIRGLARHLWVTRVNMEAVVCGGKVPRNMLATVDLQRLRECIAEYRIPCVYQVMTGGEPLLILYAPVDGDASRAEPMLRIAARHITTSFHQRQFRTQIADRVFSTMAYSKENIQRLTDFNIAYPRHSTFPPMRF